MRTTPMQIRLHIRAVRSASLLFAAEIVYNAAYTNLGTDTLSSETVPTVHPDKYLVLQMLL